ncbi:uncharacterized protein LOC127242357 [Andrographis paniculata]|uniref:uncharacterized protein LOC127242357 n=1 Tax=Andrographis paniculata TaxID=175694 RepID=UPI0021E802BA|nr:uncharacterized protein LOC127242357 [Andrographis paniculata]
MGDALEKPAGSSSLAVVENRPKKHGGCVGIFFQLFDWNRRFAKKKLFSKKLLPPADRLKPSSKKFCGDEKQPKIRLIADENKGGFPHGKSCSNGGVDQKHEMQMRVPGLVARLMGLETMPTRRIINASKSGSSGTGSRKQQQQDKGKKGKKLVEREEEEEEAEEEEELISTVTVEDKDKPESRPPKLQKTLLTTSVVSSVSERSQPQPQSQAVIRRFGVEKLPQRSPSSSFKNALLSKARKHHHHHHHHHPRLPTPVPVKSPKSGSRKGSSRLLIEAAASRILEPAGLQTSRRSKCGLTNYSNEHPKRQMYSEDQCGQHQCLNCTGYLLDSWGEEEHVVFESRSREISKPKNSSPNYYCGMEDKTDIDNSTTVQPHITFTSYKCPLSEQGDPLKRMPVLSFGCVPKAQSECDQMDSPKIINNSKVSSRISVPSSVNATSVGNNISRPQLPSRRDNRKFDLEKRMSSNKLSDTVSPGRKRRSSNSSGHGFESSKVPPYQNYNFHQPMMGNQTGCYNGHVVDQKCIRNSSLVAENGQVGKTAVSFPLHSPVKSRSRVSEGKVKNNVHFGEGELLLLQSTTGKHGRKKRLEKPLPRLSLSRDGDALGALLEEKLNELTCQKEDIQGGTPPLKTTAMILQELLSALTSETSSSFQPEANFPTIPEPDGRNGCNFLPDSTTSSISQGRASGRRLYVDHQLDSDHLSPESVLEAYCSTESCPSSRSMDEFYGYKMVAESTECSYDSQGWLSPNSEPLDAMKIHLNRKELMTQVLNNVSEVLCSSKLANCGLKGIDLEEAREVLLHAELTFLNARGQPSPIKHLVLDELEALAGVLWMNFGCSLGTEDENEVLTRFVFDSIVEHLGSKKKPRKVLQTNGKMLMVESEIEMVEAVRKWEEMCRKSLDEVVEKEMDRSAGEWTQCESEARETGVGISVWLYNYLVEEAVMDLIITYYIKQESELS